MTDATTIEQKGRCRKCKRVLKNPKHAEAGIGPVCARKEGVTVKKLTPQEYHLGCRANYTVVMVDKERQIVFINDVGHDKGCPSVTNDAEAVVKSVIERNSPDYRIVYRDSMGRWDELMHNGKQFTAFAAFHEEHP